MEIDHYAAVLAVLPEPTLVTTSAGTIQAANTSAEGLLKCLPGGLVGRQLSEFACSEEEKLAAFLRAASRSGTPIPGGVTLADREGNQIACRLEGAALSATTAMRSLFIRIVPHEAAVRRFVSLNLRIDELNREIARRQHAEIALREQHEWLHVTLSSIGDAVIATDAAGNVTFMNGCAELQTGWTRSEAAGRPLEEVFVIVREADGVRVENPVSKVLREGRGVRLTNHNVMVVARDGTTRPIDESGSPILDANNTIIGVVLVFQDITERRKIDIERVEADRRKDEFLAMLAHELRNPLAALGNGIEYFRVAAVGSHDPRMEALVGSMHRQMRHLSRLVEDLVDVARITTGKIALNKTPLPLRVVLEDAIVSCRSLIDKRRIDLRVVLPDENVIVDADESRLAQVFINIISNAVKFSQPGAAVRVLVDAAENGARVRICDSGSGIDPAMLDKVFELFVQADKSIDRPDGGLGIGLTIAKRLTELHGGVIAAFSDGLGKGSEFAVTLPYPRRVADQCQPADTHVSPRTIRKILVVDDNADAADTLALVLRMYNHEVVVTNDGTTALALAAEWQPEVMLVDLGMPGMDGYELVRTVRSKAPEHIPLIIAVSGYGSESDRGKTRESGFDHHLTKPVDFSELESLIQR